VCLASLAAACGGISSPSKNNTQDFSGTLSPQGSAQHDFSVGKSGEFFITVTDLSDRTLTVGTALYEFVNGGCAPTGFVQPFSRWNQQALGGPISKGTYCLVVYDPGVLTAPLNYTVRVSYP
jgi:hypothetical protein